MLSYTNCTWIFLWASKQPELSEYKVINYCSAVLSFKVFKMALKATFIALVNEMNIKLDNEETRFSFEQMCCLKLLNISTVGKLYQKWKNIDL